MHYRVCTCASCWPELQCAWHGLQRYLPPPFVSSNLVTHSGISKSASKDLRTAELPLGYAVLSSTPPLLLRGADWPVTPTVKMIDNQKKGIDESVLLQAPLRVLTDYHA